MCAALVFASVAAWGQGHFLLATVRSDLQFALAKVQLIEPTPPPNEVMLGTRTVMLLPEPCTWALLGIGLGMVTCCRWRKGRAVAAVVVAIGLASNVAQGQGQFLFNAHDLSVGNDVKFETSNGQIATTALVQILAGPDFTSGSLIPLFPILSLSLPASGPTYPDPSAQVYTVPGMPAGARASVILRLIASGQVSECWAPDPVLLTESPRSPNEVFFGDHTLYVYTPEPSTWALCLLGFGAIACCFRRKAGANRGKGALTQFTL
jgi:hypothetical protein